MGKRRTLEEMATESQDPWACPECGCKHLMRCETTYRTAEGKRRRLVCRNCGKGLIRTIEVPITDIDSTDADIGKL